MPSQGATLVKVAAVPGAINLDADTLRETDILSVSNGGPTSAQATIAVLAERLGVLPLGYHSRVVTENSEAVVDTDDVALLVDKTVSSATSFLLPDPILRENDDGTFLGRVLIFTDMKGDAQNYPITLDAGAGNTINGAQTLVMDVNYTSTILIGESDTQWGVLGSDTGTTDSSRTRLTADTTFYVDKATGNDANSGLIGFPKEEIQSMIADLKANYDLGGFQVTISVADGTYTTSISAADPWVGGGGETPAVSIVAVNAKAAILSTIGYATRFSFIDIHLNGLKIMSSLDGGGSTIGAFSGAIVTHENMWFAGAGHEGIEAHGLASVTAIGPTWVSGRYDSWNHFTEGAEVGFEDQDVHLVAADGVTPGVADITDPNAGPRGENYIFGGNRGSCSYARAAVTGSFSSGLDPDDGITYDSRIVVHIGAILNLSSTTGVDGFWPGYIAPQIDSGGLVLYDSGVADTIYLRLTAQGNNADGYADNDVRAFLTSQNAFSYIAKRPPDQFYALVPVFQCGPGTWPAFTPPDLPGVAVAILRGDPVTPGNCIISTTAAHCVEPSAVQTLWILDGFQMTSSARSCISAPSNSKIQFQNCIFADANMSSHIALGKNSFVEATGTYSVTGNAGSFISNGGGSIIISTTGTFVGARTYSVATVFSQTPSFTRWDGTKTIDTSVTGTRVNLANQAFLNSNNTTDQTSIPGSVDGPVDAATFALLV